MRPLTSRALCTPRGEARQGDGVTRLRGRVPLGTSVSRRSPHVEVLRPGVPPRLARHLQPGDTGA